MAPHRHRGFQYEEGVAKRIGKFCPSDSVRPTDRLHALNIHCAPLAIETIKISFKVSQLDLIALK